MSLFSIDIRCAACDEVSDIIVARELGTNWEHKHECPKCHEASAVRIMSAPLVFKEAYHDGYKRGGDYQLVKESAKLAKAAAGAKGSAKSELQKAAHELQRAAKNERPKTT
jgi:hypothetical protein